MKPRHKRFAFIGLGLVALGVATVLMLERIPEQSRVLFYAHSSGQRGSAAGTQLPHRRDG